MPISYLNNKFIQMSQKLLLLNMSLNYHLSLEFFIFEKKKKTFFCLMTFAVLNTMYLFTVLL